MLLYGYKFCWLNDKIQSDILFVFVFYVSSTGGNMALKKTRDSIMPCPTKL